MRIRIALTTILALVAMRSAAAEEPVYFADTRLKTAVEGQLWVSDPTPTDMLGLTYLKCIQFVTGTDTGITDLTGLEYATNLQTLYVRWNQVSDLSPLSDLKNLRDLYLTRNNISDLSPLSGLDNLGDLDLHGNQVSDISALAGLANLRELNVRSNQISDLSALTDLTSLRDLDVRNNPLSGDTCSSDRAQIEANNPGITIQHDCGPFSCSISSTAGGSVTNPGEGTFTYGRGETLLLTAEPEVGCVFTNWSGDYCSTQNPVSLTINNHHTIRANFIDILGDRRTLWVDDDAAKDPGPNTPQVSDPQENGTAAHPFDRIQEAIDLAGEETRILVRPGTYRETIDLRGKRIQLTGIDPNDPNQISYPVLDGAGEGPVVSFTQGEDPNCTLTGFVITGGQDGQAGAILCSHSSPTITHCLIAGNRATDPNGAAIHCTDSNAVFVNCTISDNYGGEKGSGLQVVDGNVVLVNSIVWGNTPNDMIVAGAGNPLVSYSDVGGGFPGLENLDTDPLFLRHGYWTDPNDPDTALGPNDDGVVWVEGDYHLRSQTGRWDPQKRNWVTDDAVSPCIDAGDPLEAVDAEPTPNGDVINMGAYGGTRQASKAPAL